MKFPLFVPDSRRAALAALAAVTALGLGTAAPAGAQVPEIFRNADLKLGERLIAENKCNDCHARNWTNDGKAVYRPRGRIDSPGKLRGMVEQCNTQFNLGLFPEDVTAIAAVLNRDHYKFR